MAIAETVQEAVRERQEPAETFHVPTQGERKAKQAAAAQAGVSNPTLEQKAEQLMGVPVPDDVSPRHAEFARQFLLTSNATRAAIAAGYAEESADVEGSRVLGDPRVQRYMCALSREMARAWSLDALTVQGLLLQSHFRAGADKQHGPSVRAAELLGKSLPDPMFTDRHEHHVRQDDGELLEAIRELASPDELQVIEHALDRSKAVEGEVGEGD